MSEFSPGNSQIKDSLPGEKAKNSLSLQILLQEIFKTGNPGTSEIMNL